MSYRVETDTQHSRDSTPDPTTSTGLPLTPVALLSPSTSGSDHSESSATSSATLSSTSPTKSATPSSDGQIDLGTIVQAANGSWDRLSAQVTKLLDDRKKQYPSFHSKPSVSDCLHSHPVTKMGRSWNVSFQMKVARSVFVVLSFLEVYCILFPEPPARGDELGRGSGVGALILSPYKSPYSKALGKQLSEQIFSYENTATLVSP